MITYTFLPGIIEGLLLHDAGTVVHAVLEPMPKWGVLQDVLAEIQEERARLACSDEEADRKAAAAPVVVMAREAHTCAQLREVREGSGLGVWSASALGSSWESGSGLWLEWGWDFLMRCFSLDAIVVFCRSCDHSETEPERS